MVENSGKEDTDLYPLYKIILKNLKIPLDKIAILSYNIIVTHKRLKYQQSKRRKIS